MNQKQKLDAIFALGQLQGIKLAIETAFEDPHAQKVADVLQDIYDCLHDCIVEEET